MFSAGPMATDTSEVGRKEHFLGAMGLLTQAALLELTNKKSIRKRRTTANPKFSTAAIEAKRVVAMEAAAQKARRREEMMVSGVQQRKRPVLLQTRNQVKVSFRRQLDVDEGSDGNRLNVVMASSRDNSICEPSSSKPVASCRKSLSHKRPNLPRITQDCQVCEEKCQPELDLIIFCSTCRLLFHATCVGVITDLTANSSVACVKCKTLLPLSNEVTAEEMSCLMMVAPKPKAKRAKVMKKGEMTKSVTLSRENGCSEQVDLKCHFKAKLQEQCHLVNGKIKEEERWSLTKRQLDSTKSKLKDANYNRKIVQREQEKYKRKIDALTQFIKSFKASAELVQSAGSDEPVTTGVHLGSVESTGSAVFNRATVMPQPAVSRKHTDRPNIIRPIPVKAIPSVHCSATTKMDVETTSGKGTGETNEHVNDSNIFAQVKSTNEFDEEHDEQSSSIMSSGTVLTGHSEGMVPPGDEVAQIEAELSSCEQVLYLVPIDGYDKNVLQAGDESPSLMLLDERSLVDPSGMVDVAGMTVSTIEGNCGMDLETSNTVWSFDESPSSSIIFYIQ